MAARFNPNDNEPSRDELKGKSNLEKNDFLALVIAAVSVFLPIVLLFVAIVAVIAFVLF